MEQEAWDTAWTSVEFNAILRQVEAVSDGQNFWIALYSNHVLLSTRVAELAEKGYKNISVFTWWKNNFNMENVMGILYATEYIILAWRTGLTQNMPCVLDKNPTKRHNMFIGPQQRAFHKDQLNNMINPYQKPAYLAYNMCKAFCNPFDEVFILGSGAGGDIEGCVAAGMNVVALEKDARQYAATLAVWRRYQERLRTVDRDVLFASALEGKMGSAPDVVAVPPRFEHQVRELVTSLLAQEEQQAILDATTCTSCDANIGDPTHKNFGCSVCGKYVCESCANEVARSFGKAGEPKDGRFCCKRCFEGT